MTGLAGLRRALHGHPEVGLDLPRTQRAILDALDGLGLEITTGRGLSSVTAVLRGGRPGPVVLLRSDMDGLPVTEATGLPYASVNGAMHACGHDLHMAGLVGAARILAGLPGTVVFMFQPGEEGFAGGKLMIEEGVLDAAGERPVAAYAVHVDCVTPAGHVVTRPGPIMSSANALRVRVTGTGGHAALPQDSVDPVPVAAEIILAIQSFTARRIPVSDPAVISVTRLSSDSPASNVLATTVSLEANVRALSRQTLALIRTELPKLVTAIGAAHGCTVATEFVESYPVTVNDPAETARVLALLDERYGDRVVRLPFPGMASEDFAYVLDEVPGTLIFLGVQPEDGTSGPMHSDRAVFDDSRLDEHAALLATLARRRLSWARSAIMNSGG
ncbi:M20 metallopeptidase family protein [Actinoplanes rectilineatus]|uniref:M20 metallopeptidase family protein n=1 Tax=Actinoplanes rectilineatus TaxID=113571 RepID=UPI0005F29670|nr:M20 family metallopeptidase [Actinoplanes rectilineatus]